MKNPLQISAESAYPTGRYASQGEHLRLLARDESAYVPPMSAPAAGTPIDAIIVPTNRISKAANRNFGRIMQVAREHGAGVVVFLCSQGATKEVVSRVALNYPRQPWLAVDFPAEDYEKSLPLATRHSYLAQRKNFDLADKRNFGIELARRAGWRTVFFLDDDIQLTPAHLDKAASLLEGSAEVVGFNVRKFPDHSAAVMANQQVNRRVDSFLGGGVLALKATSDFLPFFPHIYNEDWLFSLVYSLTSGDKLVWAGTAKQKPLKSYWTPRRAECEEPGDLLAEGLFRLAMEIKATSKQNVAADRMLDMLVKKAGAAFWEQEIGNRMDFLRSTERKLRGKRMLRNRRAMLSGIRHSLEVITGYGGTGGLRAEDFAQWVKSWARDLRAWNDHLASAARASDLDSALRGLGCEGRYAAGPDFREAGLADSGAAWRAGLNDHPLSGFLRLCSTEVLERAVSGHESTRYLHEYGREKRLGMAYAARAADKLRYDRPLFEDGVRPYMTVAMLVRSGEPDRNIRQSIRAIGKHAQEGAPIQILLWFYADATISQREQERYRNALVAKLVADTQNTNVRLRSYVVKRKGTVDSVIDSALTDTLFAYWKCGIQLDHYFVVVNSRNQPFRHGTREQFSRREYGFADKPLSAYLQQPGLATRRTPYKDPNEIAVARSWFDGKVGLLQRMRQRFPGFVSATLLRLDMRGCGLAWLELDSLAHTTRFHGGYKWQSIQNVSSVLCVQVPFRDSLPSDMYAAFRRIAAAINKNLDIRKNGNECVLVVTGQPHHSWRQLQDFRQALMDIVVASPELAEKVVFTSLIYRREASASRRRARLVIRSLVRYIHWLENHNRSQRFIWRALG